VNYEKKQKGVFFMKHHDTVLPLNELFHSYARQNVGVLSAS